MDELHVLEGGTRAALRERIAQHGYAYLRGLVPRDDVLAVRRAVLAALDAHRFAWTDVAGRARPGPAIAREGAPSFLAAYAALQEREAFHRLAHHPALRAVLRELVGDDVFTHPCKIARLSPPDMPEATTPPHQDFRYIQGTSDVFTTWLPLGACPPGLGGLKVLAGSHTGGLRPALPVTYGTGIAVDVDADDPAWATADFEPGDVVLFHSFTVHGALPNESSEVRLSADFRHQSARDPVAAPSLRPHWHPDVPGWAELTAGWSDDTAVRAPEGLSLSEFRRLDADLDPPPSRYFEVTGGVTRP